MLTNYSWFRVVPLFSVLSFLLPDDLKDDNGHDEPRWLSCSALILAFLFYPITTSGFTEVQLYNELTILFYYQIGGGLKLIPYI